MLGQNSWSIIAGSSCCKPYGSKQHGSARVQLCHCTIKAYLQTPLFEHLLTMPCQELTTISAVSKLASCTSPMPSLCCLMRPSMHLANCLGTRRM